MNTVDELIYMMNKVQKAAVETRARATKKKAVPMYKVYDKSGKPNVKGLIYQTVRFNQLDKRPFVLELITKEVERIQEEIIKLKSGKVPNFHYNIKLHSMYNDLCGVTQVSLQDCILFYEFQKEKANKKKYNWIAPYLTKDNMQKEYVCLFYSKKRHVFIKHGNMVFEEFNDRYSTPIKLTGDDQFHL